MSAEPTSAAPRFPQLAIAKDPERMRAVLQQHLQPLAGRTYQIRQCRVSFSRDRSDRRCLLQYTLDLVEPDTGRAWSQLVTGVIYAGGSTARIWNRLERAEARRARAETRRK